MGKRIVFPGSYYDTRRFEAWLSQRATEGLRFYKFSSQGKITVFEEKEPKRIRYYVEPDFGQYTAEEMENAYTDLGWIFLEELRGTCLVYESEELWATRPTRRFEDRDLTKKWRKIIWGQIGTLFLEILSIYLLAKPFLDLNALYITEHPVVVSALLVFTGILILQNLWPLNANIYDLYAWNHCVRMGEETEEWRGIVIFRWGEFVLYWLTIITLPLLFYVVIPAL
jgi:hypothetical protein